MREVELVIDAKATLGEGPCWDSNNQLLYWVDILEKKVCIHNPATGDNREILVDQWVGTIVPSENGGFIIAMENGFYSLNIETEETELLYDLESHLPDNRFNDGKCDPYGRFWAGSMSKNGKNEQGALYCLDTNLNVTKKLNKIGISNGLAWSLDNKYMYYIDSDTQKVARYDYDVLTGHIENRIEVIHFEEGEGIPDGMTIDEEGKLWIAHWGGSKISRWDPETGKQLTHISIPALNVTSCTFGGSDLSELYITTARTGMNDKDLLAYPNAGGVFKIKTEVKGTPSNRFKG